MPKSRFGRFKDGVQVSGVSLNVHQKGKVFYVCNSSTLAPLGIAGSDGNDGLTPERPFSTIDKAINSATASRGDKIIVMEGHAETIADATSLVPDVAGLQILGQGVGENRPIITFATATTANIPVSGANTRISNMVFKCNIASQAAMITTTADDVEIDNCSFREGSATGLNFITIGAADGDSDRFYIHDCDFYMPTAGNGDHAIEILKDMTNGRIEDCDIDGDFDEGGILIPSGGDAQVNLRILRCNIKNRLAGVSAIDIDGTASSGIIQDCLLRTDAIATALDNGSLATDNVRYANETDQVVSVPVALHSDVFVPGLGYRVTKTEDVNTATSDNLFDLTGKVLITLWTAEVTNALAAGVTDYKIEMTTSNKVLLAAGNIASAAVGHMIQLNGDSAATALNTSTGAVSVTGEADNAGKGLAMRVVGLAGSTDVLKSTRTAGDAGDAIVHVLYYLPLEAGAKVTASA